MQGQEDAAGRGQKYGKRSAKSNCPTKQGNSYGLLNRQGIACNAAMHALDAHWLKLTTLLQCIMMMMMIASHVRSPSRRRKSTTELRSQQKLQMTDMKETGRTTSRAARHCKLASTILLQWTDA